MHDNGSEHKNSGFTVYVVTWISLLVLTAITVTVAGMHLGKLSVVVALLIASVKAGVVLSFFMHLKYEAPLFKVMVWVTLTTLTIFIGLTFFDVSFR